MTFTRTFGKAAPKRGMRMVAINPGAIATDRIEMLLRARAAREFGDADRWVEFQADMPFGRLGHPDEIASAVAFLASPRSAYTTGRC